MTIHLVRRPNVVFTIITINIMVYLFWLFLGLDDLMMSEQFLTSWQAVAKGRFWTLLTSVFSHCYFFHLLINMYVFFGFGSMLENLLGQVSFTVFFLLAGLAGSLGHIFVSHFLLGQSQLSALGASGAVSGVIILFSLFYPKEKILLLGLIPLPAITGALIFVSLDLWGLFFQAQGGSLPIGHGAHLGGSLFGVIYFFSKKHLFPSHIL